jgi:uncharacterized membrane protein
MVDEKKETTPEDEKKKTGEPKKRKAPVTKKDETKQATVDKKRSAQKATPKKKESKQSATGKRKPAQKAVPKKAEEQKAAATKAPVSEPGEATAEEIEAGKGLAAISYISILFLIPMISMRDNRFAMFHAKQSMVLVISAMVLFFGLFIIGVLTSWLGIGILLIVLAYVAFFAYFVLMIIGFVKAFNGEYWRIPKISDWADKIKI